MNVVDLKTGLALPDTVIGKVPAGVVDVEVVMVRMVEQVGVHTVVEKLAVAPVGSPEAEKNTLWLWLDDGESVAVMVVAPEPP